MKHETNDQAVRPSGGILRSVKAEGFAEGWSQAAQVAWDDAYLAGRVDALRERAGDHWKWCAFGLICGIGASALAVAFL